MRGAIITRRETERESRVSNEVEKAIRFASIHGEWPIDLSPAAGRAVVRRSDGDVLQRQWGDVVEAVLER